MPLYSVNYKIFMHILYQALERELAPVEERLRKLTDMARQVASANPSEAKAVRDRKSEITDLWENLKVSNSVMFCNFFVVLLD